MSNKKVSPQRKSLEWYIRRTDFQRIHWWNDTNSEAYLEFKNGAESLQRTAIIWEILRRHPLTSDLLVVPPLEVRSTNESSIPMYLAQLGAKSWCSLTDAQKRILQSSLSKPIADVETPRHRRHFCLDPIIDLYEISLSCARSKSTGSIVKIDGEDVPFTVVEKLPVPTDPKEVKVFKSKLVNALCEEIKAEEKAGYQIVAIAIDPASTGLEKPKETVNQMLDARFGSNFSVKKRVLLL